MQAYAIESNGSMDLAGCSEMKHAQTFQTYKNTQTNMRAGPKKTPFLINVFPQYARNIMTPHNIPQNIYISRALEMIKKKLRLSCNASLQYWKQTLIYLRMDG